MVTVSPRRLQFLVSRARQVFRKFERARTSHSEMWQLHVRLEKDDLDGGWIATCVDLPGCMSEGETEEEAIGNLANAISEVLGARLHRELEEQPLSNAGGHSRRLEMCV